MIVKLINHTRNPIQTIFIAARTCYSADGPEALWNQVISPANDNDTASSERMFSLIDKVIASGHMSVLEHISFTFAIEGISRACSHQLVRHRIASFSQQSQRYVAVKDDDFVVPNSIESNPDAMNIYEKLLHDAQSAYKSLMALGVPQEDARFALPNASFTNIVMTMNFRELHQVCQIRLCTRAQWEIRELFWKAKSEIKNIEELKGLAEYLQPKCIMLGYCPEHKSCGMMPGKDEIFQK